MNEYCVCLITASSSDEARTLATGLLEGRLAACVNLLPRITSMYWWEGKLEEAQEVLLVVKTRSVCLEDVIRRVKELHSYSVPEVVALPIQGGNPDYLAWVKENVA
ncbi:MAG: divalent-cation tolerance protein CutA [Candidatus Eremiobacterota bacterium]